MNLFAYLSNDEGQPGQSLNQGRQGNARPPDQAPGIRFHLLQPDGSERLGHHAAVNLDLADGDDPFVGTGAGTRQHLDGSFRGGDRDYQVACGTSVRELGDSHGCCPSKGRVSQGPGPVRVRLLTVYLPADRRDLRERVPASGRCQGRDSSEVRCILMETPDLSREMPALLTGQTLRGAFRPRAGTRRVPGSSRTSKRATTFILERETRLFAAAGASMAGSCTDPIGSSDRARPGCGALSFWRSY